MLVSKVFKVLVIGTFLLVAVNAGSISLRTNGFRDMWLNLTYAYNGQTVTNPSKHIEENKNEIIRFPDGAVNVNLMVYEDFYTTQVIFTKFYPLSVEKCFAVFTNDVPARWFEQPCKKLPPSEYSIAVTRVSQDNETLVFFDLTYDYNGSTLTETSEHISNETYISTAQIPNGATNITFKLYDDFSVDGMVQYSRRNLMMSKFYSLPVTKCFEIYTHAFRTYWSEKPCKKLAAEKGYSISVGMIGVRTYYEAMFEVMYQYYGSNFTGFSGYISPEKYKTVQVPDEATNIQLQIYVFPEYFPRKVIVSQFYPSPINKCFRLYNSTDVHFGNVTWSEDLCERFKLTNSA